MADVEAAKAQVGAVVEPVAPEEPEAVEPGLTVVKDKVQAPPTPADTDSVTNGNENGNHSPGEDNDSLNGGNNGTTEDDDEPGEGDDVDDVDDVEDGAEPTEDEVEDLDDHDMGDEVGEDEDDIQEVEADQDDDGGEGAEDDDDEVAIVNGAHPTTSSSRRKSPPRMRDIEEIDDDEDDMPEDEETGDGASSDGVEEIHDDDDEGGDSDIMEVEAEDPLGAGQASETAPKKTAPATPNVVTIDDLKTIQRLASNASKKSSAQSGAGDKASVMLIDTNAILAGKATSGVTITPAHPKTPSGNGTSLSGLNLPSGVTISQTSKSSSSAGTASASAMAKTDSPLGLDKKGQLNDPNLTDDTFVVEAPSFIVPYVYEKPPKETFDSFKDEVKKLVVERRAKEEKEKKEAKEKGEEDGAASDDDDAVKEVKGDDDIMEVPLSDEMPKKRPHKDNFFESSLGKFFCDLGMNLVQETVQTDLLKDQIRRSHKDKSAAVMHAIKSLRMNLESSKEANEPFRQSMKKCRFCSFRTESETILQHHLETPHMRQFMYRCNFCPFDTKLPQDVLQHMMLEHGVKGRLERAPGIHQCPQCPFEDNMKGKLTRHKNTCDKRYRPEKNQDAPLDWEPPAKIPKPQVVRRPGMIHNSGAVARASMGGNMRPMLGQKQPYPQMPQLQFGPRGRGRPVGMPNFNQMPGNFGKTGNPLLNSYMNRQVMQALQSGGGSPKNLLPAGSSRNTFQNNQLLSSLGSNSSVTIQSVNQRSGHNRSNTTPSISITPLPGRPSGSAAPNRNRPTSANNSPAGIRPGAASGGASGKGNFVICEICDGYIKDLEQLRNHMLWIHKVKIHPKMIYNRPPLNCQKCQFRFFTDQGLERHLLGSHGLVTAAMQELANKGKDSGRCPVCGKVFQWKLLNHVAKDHQKTLKPAHLSYKCTVCTATFGQYKLFENHVYQAHSGAAKKADKAKQLAKASAKAPVKVPDDITIIPKPNPAKGGSNASTNSTSSKKPDVINIDDEEEEIDDVEEDSVKKRKASSPIKVDGEKASKKAKPEDDDDEIQEVGDDESDQDGVEEIQDDEPEDD